MKPVHRIVAAATLAAAAAASNAAAVVYDFNDFNGDLLAATAVPAHLSASRVDIANTAGSWGGLCWNTDLGGTNDFACGGFGSSTLSFTVTAAAGYVFDVNAFTFEGLGPGGEFGPTGYAVYSSLDGFSTALIGGSLAGVPALQRIAYDAGLVASGLTGPLELRIVSTGRETLPASAWLLDNFRLDVDVRQAGSVPEPGSLALVAVALGAAAWRRRTAC